MTFIIRQLRTFLHESPKKKSKDIRRKSLTVKISKEPPVIVYFERDTLKESSECIFDPSVNHDEEKDHPDLFKQEKKPYQKPPFCKQSRQTTTTHHTLKSIFKSTLHLTISMFSHTHNTSSINISEQSFI